MTTVNDIERALFEWAPLSLAVKDDKVGLQAGERHKPVRRVLVSLDVTQAVINEAIFQARADVIVSHHGILRGDFRPTDDTDAGALLLTLCQTGIASVAMHTNLDAAEGGVNDVLAKMIGLKKVIVFDKTTGIGRMGRLPAPTTVRDFAAHCKKITGTCAARYHDAGRPVQNVAVGAGGGGSVLEEAIMSGCDTFFTGEVSHHAFLTARNRGVNLIECGHFATENVIVPEMADYLRTHVPGIIINISRAASEPYQCL
ncbi:MAG: Nif3-like dinuclear metal center hexameric protein [Oscillospiraceae bacterium]|nr:Nif3-like dinuclear metal center hexameric protein [Oscillospiraceae bacterium]